MRPSALAVFRLTANSNTVGCSIGVINSDDPQIRLALSVPSDAHPMALQKGSPKASDSFINYVSIKAVAAVATNDKVAIAFHHAISRLPLFVLGLRPLITIWRNKRIGIATFATVVHKTRFQARKSCDTSI